MNAPLYNFCLFLLWLGVALFALVFGPLVYPKEFGDSSKFQFLGLGAVLLAIWNFAKWWYMRQNVRLRAFRQEMEEAYRRRTNPLTKEKEEKPVLHPEFQFEESRHKLPPPPPPNGSAH
jgi:hypothetical protein